jgi:hypothetical protein
MGLGNAQARTVLEAAFAARGHTPTLAELQIAQAIGRFEGRYGAWGPGNASNNWGAIQCGHVAPCGDGCFGHNDSHADGEVYAGCFRIFDSPQAGAEALLYQLYRREGVPGAMAMGSATGTAEAMRATGYFEAPATAYAKAIEAHSGLIAKDLGEPHMVSLAGTVPPPQSPPDGGGAAPIFVAIGLGAALAWWKRRRGSR